MYIGSVSNDDGDGNENGQKVIIGLDCQNNNFFVHFFAVAGKFLISRFIEDVNTRQQRLSFSFPEL